MKYEQGDRCPYYGHLSPSPRGELLDTNSNRYWKQNLIASSITNPWLSIESNGRRARGQVPILWAPVSLSSWRALGDQIKSILEAKSYSEFGKEPMIKHWKQWKTSKGTGAHIIGTCLPLLLASSKIIVKYRLGSTRRYHCYQLEAWYWA